RRIDASGELAQLAKGLAQLQPRCVKLIGRFILEHPTQSPHREGENHEPLLRAIVKVAFEATAFDICSLDVSCAGRAKLFELSVHLGVESLALQRQPRGSADLL